MVMFRYSHVTEQAYDHTEIHMRGMLVGEFTPMDDQAQAASAPKPGRKPAARKGGKGVTIWLDPAVWYQLRLLSLKRQETTQDMVAGWIAAEVARQG
jgi:hypothetical protein